MCVRMYVYMSFLTPNGEDVLTGKVSSTGRQKLRLEFKATQSPSVCFGLWGQHMKRLLYLQ